MSNSVASGNPTLIRIPLCAILPSTRSEGHGTQYPYSCHITNELTEAASSSSFCQSQLPWDNKPLGPTALWTASRTECPHSQGFQVGILHGPTGELGGSKLLATKLLHMDAG